MKSSFYIALTFVGPADIEEGVGVIDEEDYGEDQFVGEATQSRHVIPRKITDVPLKTLLIRVL